MILEGGLVNGYIVSAFGPPKKVLSPQNMGCNPINMQAVGSHGGIYKYLEPLCPLFLALAPPKNIQNNVFSNQNTGHFGSRYQ